MRPLLAALLVAAFCAGLVAAAHPVRAAQCDPWDYICQSLQQAKNQQEQNRKNLETIRQQITDLQLRMRALTKEIDKIGGQIRDQQAEIDRTNARLDELQRQIRFTDADIVRREANLLVRQQLLDQRVRAMDKQGKVRYLSLVVNSTSFTQLVDRLMLAQEIVQADHRMIDDLNADRLRVRTLQEDQRGKEREQATLLDRQQAQKASLEAYQQQQRDVLAEQKKLEDQFQAQRQELERQAAVIEAQVKDLQAQFDAEAKGLGGGTGKFTWPEGFRNISQPFGCSDLLGEPYDPRCASRHFHTGIDIAGPDGTPIYAADAGVISLTGGWGGGYGNYAIVIHGNGWSTLYGHMSSFAVVSGKPVPRGQVIGYEGSTGYSTGPHLHFEIRYQDVPQDPCRFIGC